MKIINSKVLFLILLFATTIINLHAQRYDTLLEKLELSYPQEKLYFHFDRSVYVAGETIWFKAYLFTGNLPSLISKTLYTELTDGKGKVLQRNVSPFIRSGAIGSLDIPDDVVGPVFVRAYTKWMLNFDSSLLYTKSLPVISSQKGNDNLSVSAQSIDTSLTTITTSTLQFFPEGGDLVQGVESLVAFKSTDQFGFPVHVSGDVFNIKGEKITSFSSVHDGMGTFILLPEVGDRYNAVWKDEYGKKQESLLPIAKPAGIVLEVNNFLKRIEFKLTRSLNAPGFPYVYVVAQKNQHLLYMAKASLINQTTTGVIPIDNLTPGIVQITVFGPGDQPLAERIVFGNSSNYKFLTEVNSSIKDLDKRKKNIIRIEVPDTFSCNLSVSITDADLDPPNEQDNIYSSILLTSDIKGKVYNPAYYFSNASDSVASHLDLVMMTNGWRRFKWENVLAGYFPKIIYNPDDYISIEGQVHGLNKTLLSGKEISGIIELKNKNRQFLNTPINQNGQFIISGLIFYDTAKFFYQFNNDKNKKLTSKAVFEIKNNILVEPLNMRDGSPISKSSKTFQIKNSEILQQQVKVLELQKVKTLRTVVVTSRKKTRQEIMDEEYASGLFSKGVSHTFLPEEDSFFLSSKNVLNFLRGKIAGLDIGIRMQITWRGYQTIVFINERQEEDLTHIMAIRMSEVAMIKVFNPPFYGAIGGGPGGAIAIYLKKGFTEIDYSKGLKYINLSGYSSAKEFYSPDYSKSNQKETFDYRPTLYWNPWIILDKNQRTISLSFYNNDITKKMKIIVEGVSEDGRLASVEKILQ